MIYVDNKGFTVDITRGYTDPTTGTQYPNLLDVPVRTKLGIKEVTPPAKKDIMYYDVSEMNTPPYVTNTPRPIDDTTVTDPITNLPTVNKGLRSQLIDRVNSNCAVKLTATDWVITRASEGYKPAPATVITDRKALRDTANATVAKLLVAKTHTTLMNVKL